MVRASTEQGVNAVLSREFEIDEANLVPTANLYEDLELDSLDAVDLVAALERQFQMKIDRHKDEETIRQMRTLADVYGFVDTKLGEKTSQSG